HVVVAGAANEFVITTAGVARHGLRVADQNVVVGACRRRSRIISSDQGIVSALGAPGHGQSIAVSVAVRTADVSVIAANGLTHHIASSIAIKKIKEKILAGRTCGLEGVVAAVSMIGHVTASIAIEGAAGDPTLVENVIAASGRSGHVAPGVAIKNILVR